MPAEKEGNIIEELLNNNTSKELLKLKKKLAKEITEKLGIKIFKKTIINYLTNEGNLKDLIGDKFKESLLGDEGLRLITPQLKELRKKINNANTEETLEKLRTEIFAEIGKENQQSAHEAQESNNTSNPTSQTSEESSSNTNESNSTSQTSSEESLSNTQKAKVDSSCESYEIDHFNITVSPESKKIWENLKGKEKPDLEPFACAMKAYETEKSAGHLKNTKYLTVVDFTKNQLTSNRLFVIDMETNTVTYAEKCGHGEGSGDKEWAKIFSNRSGFYESSLGAFITADKSRSNGKGTWHGNFPKGQESSNSASYGRGIARHPVKSLTYKSGKPTSKGCFTIPRSQAYVDEMLEKTQGGSLLFSYAKSKDYFKQSKYFQENADGSVAA